MKLLARIISRTVLRLVVLLICVVLGTITLMRLAPGYYSDARELDASGSALLRQALQRQQVEDAGPVRSSLQWIRSAATGDLGQSRQFSAPVATLLADRTITTLRLLTAGVFSGWLAAGSITILLTFIKSRTLRTFCLVPVSWLLVLPIGALAVMCFTMDVGGPIVVVALFIAAREVQFFTRLLEDTVSMPHFLYLRASGMRRARIFWKFAVPQLAPQFLSLLLRSLLAAIGVLVPIEVVFDVAGVGQLAWTATMNRDLPVLTAITIMIACTLAVSGMIADVAAERRQA